MRPEEYYLRDMVHAGENISLWSSEIDWEFFQRSPLHQAAIKFELMVIGEAASKTSAKLKERYDDLSWRSLKDFRNLLAHEYFALDLDLVWEAAIHGGAVLASRIREILGIEYPGFPIDVASPRWK